MKTKIKKVKHTHKFKHCYTCNDDMKEFKAVYLVEGKTFCTHFCAWHYKTQILKIDE